MHSHIPRSAISLSEKSSLPRSEHSHASVGATCGEDHIHHVEEDIADAMETEQEDSQEAEEHMSSRNAVGAFLLRLKGEANISNAACSMIATEMGEMCKRLLHEYECEVSSGQSPTGFTVESLPTYAACKEFSSSYKLDKFCQDDLGCIEPVAVRLEGQGPPKHVQFASVKSQLQHMCCKGLISEDMLRKRCLVQASELYEDIYAKDSTEQMTNEKSIDLIFYYDDFQTGNPLGPHTSTGKLGAVYFTLGNFGKIRRGQTKYIFLTLLFQSSAIKSHGFNNVLKPLVDELKELEADGLYYSATGETIPVRVLMFIADNLAAHEIAGMRKSFSKSTHCCRFCLCSSHDIRQMRPLDGEKEFPAVSPERYQEEIAKAERGELSAFKHQSILNQLNTFHITSGLPPDAAHDVLEGVGQRVLSLVLTDLILKQKKTTLARVNACITNFEYAHVDKRDRPVELKQQNGKITAKQKASQSWTLIRLLPLMIGDEVQPCEEWDVLVGFGRIAEYIFALKLDDCDVDILQENMENWMQEVMRCFPDFSPTAKFHFLRHYPQQIRKHGPPRYYWTLRFEQKHQILKSLSKNSLCKKMSPKLMHLTISNTWHAYRVGQPTWNRRAST